MIRVMTTLPSSSNNLNQAQTIHMPIHVLLLDTSCQVECIHSLVDNETLRFYEDIEEVSSAIFMMVV